MMNFATFIGYLSKFHFQLEQLEPVSITLIFLFALIEPSVQGYKAKAHYRILHKYNIWTIYLNVAFALSKVISMAVTESHDMSGLWGFSLCFRLL